MSLISFADDRRAAAAYLMRTPPVVVERAGNFWLNFCLRQRI